jgi:dolichol-phosphate mannosyltransferase
MNSRPEEAGGRTLGLLSVVTPVHNEEDVLPEFRARLWAALEGVPFEVLFVDDGSTDGSGEFLRALSKGDDRARVVTLSRNFGHQAAITAGLDRASGDATVVLDSDLQDPPELIAEMLERWREGFDVVTAVRRSRPGDSRSKRTLARLYYRLLGRLTDVEMSGDAGDFRLIDRRPLDALNAMRERNRFLRGMSAWVGFRQTTVGYVRTERMGGESKYTLARLTRLGLDGLTSFSRAPLRIATALGLACSGIAFLAIPVAIGFKLAGQFVPGVTTLLLIVLLLGGIQLITVGIIGEYLGQVYEEVKRRPLYVVDGATERPGPHESGDGRGR